MWVHTYGGGEGLGYAVFFGVVLFPRFCRLSFDTLFCLFCREGSLNREFDRGDEKSCV